MIGLTTSVWLKVLDKHKESSDPNIALLAELLQVAIVRAQEGRVDEFLDFLDQKVADMLEEEEAAA